MADFRWHLTVEVDAPPTLFPDVVEHRVGAGEYRGLEFYEVNAKRVINEVPKASQMPFRFTINAYRGCSHACTYCMSGETPILMGDGSVRSLADIRRGDIVYGSRRVGQYQRYERTEVHDHWSTVKRAWVVRLEDGTELIASGDHRFLTGRGWKHVSGAMCGPDQRPYLTTVNHLLGTGRFALRPKVDEDYERGYLTGIIRGDGTIGHYEYTSGRVHVFRLALIDGEVLDRTELFLASHGISVRRRRFQAASTRCSEAWSVSNSRRADVERIEQLIAWPTQPSISWCKGFLAGIFDAEGCHSGSLRIANSDPRILANTSSALTLLGFRSTLEPPQANGVRTVRLLGGLVEILRFFHTIDPAIMRKRDIDGRVIKTDASFRVVDVRDLGIDMVMYDLTTGTGNFIADGVVSHNCFARPTHEYLGFDTGADFDSKIVVKVNAVERARAEVASPRWRGDHIAMGTNTDPYQKAEGRYHLTRGIIEVLGRAANPFSILTKSTLVLRDLDVLTAAAARTEVRLNFSIGTLDRTVWKATEPGTPPPDKRVDAVRRLNDAGIPCGVLVAPILPGLSDRPDQLEAVIEACAAAGAVSISGIGLHLRSGVKEHYLRWLADARPDLMPLYDERFRGAYQPKSVQEALAAQVRALARGTEGPRQLGVVEGTLAERAEAQGLGPPRAAHEPTDHGQQLKLPL